MKNSKFKIHIYSLLCIIFIFSCEENEIFQSETAHKNLIITEATILNQQILSRGDDNCEMCAAVDACCCFVELQLPLQSTPIDLHICGVVPFTNENEGCSMDTGDGCYDVGNRGIYINLDPNGVTRHYFCIDPGTSFSLYNASYGGSGWLRVGCTTGTTISGTTAFNLPGYPPSGGFTRYFQSDANCDFEICDF